MSELDWLDDEEERVLEGKTITDIEKQVAYFRGLAEKLTNEDKLKELKIKQLSKNILGRRIRCNYICGTVVSVDGNCQIHVKLDNGGLLILNPDDDDEYTVL